MTVVPHGYLFHGVASPLLIPGSLFLIPAVRREPREVPGHPMVCQGPKCSVFPGRTLAKLVHFSSSSYPKNENLCINIVDVASTPSYKDFEVDHQNVIMKRLISDLSCCNNGNF